MKKHQLVSTLLMLLLLLSACNNDFDSSLDNYNEYATAFVRRFGVPVPGHKFNVAVAGKVTAKCSEPTDVKVVAQVEGKKYLFADYTAISGTTDINFDIPDGITRVILIANGFEYYAKLGDTVDLDQMPQAQVPVTPEMLKAKSRAYNSPTLGYVPSVENNGVVTPLGCCSPIVTDIKSCTQMTGWEIKHYTGEMYDIAGESHSSWVIQVPLTLYYLYWDKSHDPDTDYEFGIEYSVTGDSWSNTVYAPLYRTDEIRGDKSVTSILRSTRDWSYSGAEITIDFDNRTQKVTPDKWALGLPFSYFFTNFYNDSNLKTRLSKHLAKQNEIMPQPADWYAGAPAYGLPPYDENNQIEFWDKWDEFVWNYLHDTYTSSQLSGLDEFIPLKEFFGFFYMIFPYEHAYPHVTKVGSGNKYTVKFTTARFQDGEYPAPRTATSLYQRVDNDVYYMLGETDITISDREYAFYVKDLKSGKVVTSMANKVGSFYRWACTNSLTLCYQNMVCFDMDNDNMFDDFMFIYANLPTQGDNVEYDPYTWIIACEDLGSTDDWDFNDLVVEVQYISRNSANQQEITVRPLAAGGIYPIYLMFTDPLEAQGTHVLGMELHRWLGTGYRTYNTEEEFIDGVMDRPTLTFYYDVALHNHTRFTLSQFGDDIWEGTNMGGLWVLVDRKGRYNNMMPSSPEFYRFDRVLDDAKTDTNLIVINNAPRDEEKNDNLVPMMMCVGREWQWPQEREDIAEVYPGWKAWLKNPSVKWYGSKVTNPEFEPDLTKVTKRY